MDCGTKELCDSRLLWDITASSSIEKKNKERWKQRVSIMTALESLKILPQTNSAKRKRRGNEKKKKNTDEDNME
jgi:hypothetical protein